jgi:hypothetical protein
MGRFPYFVGPGGPGDTCACPCRHRPMCYLCRRDRHQIYPASAARQPAPVRTVA